MIVMITENMVIRN